MPRHAKRRVRPRRLRAPTRGSWCALKMVIDMQKRDTTSAPHARPLTTAWRPALPRRTPPTTPAGDTTACIAPWRVYLSRSPHLRTYPVERPFAAAAEAAVIRAGHALIDPAYFAAHDRTPGDHRTLMLARSDVYVGLFGRSFAIDAGATDPDHEFDQATALRLPRLVFLVEWDPPVDCSIRRSMRESSRLEAFHRRVKEAGITVATVGSPDRLELLLYQALVELRAG